MRVIIEKDALQAALRRCRRTIKRNISSVPISSSVRVTAGNDGILVEAFDPIRHVLVKLTGEIAEPGICCVSCEHFLRLLDGSRAERITVSTKETIMTVTTGDMRGTLYGFMLAEFPNLEYEENALNTLTIRAGELSAILNRIAPAQATLMLENFNGIHFSCDENRRLIVEATDKRRIHIQHSEIEVSGALPLSATVAADTIGLLRFLLESVDADSDVTVTFTPSKLYIVAGNTTVRSALLEIGYPNLMTVVPPEREKKCVALKAPFLDAIDTMARFLSGSDINPDKIRLAAQNGTIVMSCDLPGTGKCERRLDYERCEHPIRFHISYVFLRDAVAGVKGDHVTFDFEEDYLPICIRDEGFVAVIAPMRTDDDTKDARHAQHPANGRGPGAAQPAAA